ncbi:polysaccharide biosynthesis tyrosine autokinase [Sphingomonas bacterium]|uniref:GumC family protein n=1 Tax=Sphingomonas bacterium TaxID=1895847 RepID=UPI0015775C74|nr:polysaccharide biosynthesis tyrosine autokinase [Sphingomonas bacterium]
MNIQTTELIPPIDAEPMPDPTETGVGNSSLLPDPKTLLVIFWRRIWIFLAVFALVVGAAVAYATLAPRQYTSTASVTIEPRRGDPVQAAGEDADHAQSSDFIDSQILSFDSPQLSAKVVMALGLLDDPQFGGPADQVVGLNPVQERARLATAAQRLKSRVVARRLGQTTLIQIAATTQSPGQSARIANEYVTQYLNSIEQARVAADQQMNKQIDGRLDQLRVQAEQADATLQQYKIAHGLMSSEGATMAEQESSALNTQVQSARAQLAEREGRLSAARQQLKAGGGGSDVTSVLSSGTIGSLRSQEADSSRNLAQLRSRYGPRHPAVAQEEQRLEDVQRQLQAESNRIISSLQAEVSVAASGLSSLESSQGAARGRLAANASAQVGFLELQRKADAARTVYAAFLNKSRGSAARDGIEQPLATRSANAVPATAPSSPNVPLLYLVGLLMGLITGVSAVVVAEFLDGGIKTKTDVERRLGARYLGSVPDIESTLDGLRSTEPPEEYIVSHPLSTFAEALRNLRASMTLRGNKRPKVLAVTSALPREGKTTTAVCLARTLAMSGASTVFVDCDLRRHSASDILLGGREGQLLKVLAGEIPIEQGLLVDTVTDLHILATHVAPTDGRDLLVPNLISALFSQLRDQYDYVVIDTAPVLGIADARSVASMADAVVLLARWRHTSLRAADTALDLLIGVRAKVYGVALTMVDIRKFGSTGQEDVYGYHKKFKGYYVN